MTKAGTGWKRTTETCSGGPAGANEIRDWVEKGPIARGLAAQPPQWPCSLPYVEEKNILHIFWRLFFFLCVGGIRLQKRHCGLPEDTCSGIRPARAELDVDGDPQPCRVVATA